MPSFRPLTEKQIERVIKNYTREHARKNEKTLRTIKYNHRRFINHSLSEISKARFSPSDAKQVIASVNGYESWKTMSSHVKRMRKAISLGRKKQLNRTERRLLLELNFEQAAQAVVDGQLEQLESLLDATPELITERSRRSHQSTLLHYIAANGIEHDRQKTPHNAAEIAKRLLQRGASADALANTYGGGPNQTTLSLLVSSCWPHLAGLHAKLVRVLCRFGAQVDGLTYDGLPLVTALVSFYPKAAKALQAAGARMDHLLAAASVGTPEDVDGCFTPSGRLRASNFAYIGCQVSRPAKRKFLIGQAFAYAALCNNLATMNHLRQQYRCDVNASADRGIRALHLAAYTGNRRLANWLLQQGAQHDVRDQQWNASPGEWAQAGHHESLAHMLNRIEC